MEGDDKGRFDAFFTEEFDTCLDNIHNFFAEQGTEVLGWWLKKEIEVIDYIDSLLSLFPFSGLAVIDGPFAGFRRIYYGKSNHLMLNYIIYYFVHERDGRVDLVTILPSRTNRERYKRYTKEEGILYSTIH
ncbi:hypothetical protein CR205_11625 [Alteribacter lacisalsi]|uniref:Type II toxin-antitoxin system RelE/ParE family toxin n=1 Tax=Alteribacter lacisalsi TaxID=2045244 RepID=A0A2W0HHT8_9BACI|nr:hypothetical protein [Alteribacter lacisalsi]PYZ96369.1 hypothetical protein CR205_11625 [Alteribacter lacisalsi]